MCNFISMMLHDEVILAFPSLLIVSVQNKISQNYCKLFFLLHLISFQHSDVSASSDLPAGFKLGLLHPGSSRLSDLGASLPHRAANVHFRMRTAEGAVAGTNVVTLSQPVAAGEEILLQYLTSLF
eukprot:g41292.t1